MASLNTATCINPTSSEPETTSLRRAVRARGARCLSSIFRRADAKCIHLARVPQVGLQCPVARGMLDRGTMPESEFSANSWRLKVEKLPWLRFYLPTPIDPGGTLEQIFKTRFHYCLRRLLRSRHHRALGRGPAEEELDATYAEDLRAEAVRRHHGEAPRAAQHHFAWHSTWTGKCLHDVRRLVH